MAINQTEVRLAVVPSIVLIPWTRPGKNRLIFVQHIRHKLSIFVLLSLAEDSHFATDDCFAKILAARLSEVRSISTFHMKTTRISRECPGFFFKDLKLFLTRGIPKWRWFIDRNNWQVKFTRTWKEKSRFLQHFKSIVLILCTSLLPFLFRCFSTKRRAKTAGKTRNTTNFYANSNLWTSRNCLAHFPKWKSSRLVSGGSTVVELRYNKPLYTKTLGITNDIPIPNMPNT